MRTGIHFARKRYRCARPRYAITLNKRARCRAAFRAPRPTTGTPRSQFRKSPRSGSDDTTPGRDCPARFATARNTARSARGSDPLSARARTRFARACSRRACDRSNRSGWRRWRCRRGRAPLAVRSRRHNRCGHRSSRGLCGIPLERPYRRHWTACRSSSWLWRSTWRWTWERTWRPRRRRRYGGRRRIAASSGRKGWNGWRRRDQRHRKHGQRC